MKVFRTHRYDCRASTCNHKPMVTHDWSLARAIALRESLRAALADSYDLVAALKHQRRERRLAETASTRLEQLERFLG